MKLAQLIEGMESSRTDGSVDVEVTSVTGDSRLVSPGALFVAIPGLVRDGASFIEQAIKKGAVAVVTEAEARQAPGVTLIHVRDTRAAIARLAAAFYGHPSRNLSITGVTGTSGKTTTTRMIESIFDATGEPVGLIGTIEYRAGALREIADRTTPDAVVLQSWFAKMVEAKVRHAVMEVSSHALSLKRTEGIEFSSAVFTNLSRDHFDFHRGFEDYFEAKAILFGQIDAEKRAAVINLDDPWGRTLIARLKRSSVLTFGRSEEADLHPGSGFSITVDGLRGTVRTPAGEVRIESPLVGVPNLYNWLGAIGAAIVEGVPVAVIERGVAALQSVRGRFERVPGEGGPTVIVDYAHKPDALEKLLHAIREISPGRKLIVIFGCGGERDEGKRPLMGEIAARLADRTVLTSDNPRGEEPEKILMQIESGVKGVPAASYVTIPDRREAIARTIGECDEGDVVLIAGKGHENYQVIGDRIVHFDDREEAQLALESRKLVQRKES